VPTKYNTKDESQLIRDLWNPVIADNPYNFVMYVYPWGKKGTPLEKHKGPRHWQREALLEMAEHIRQNRHLTQQELAPIMFRLAMASGRGPGKSAFLAWIGHWLMSVAPGCTVIYTANTEQQLKTRTWAEYGKWLTMAKNSHWFEKTATSVKPTDWFRDGVVADLQIDPGYYYAMAQLWSEENPDAFAGVHNHHGIMVIYDEASGIPIPIWTVTEGFFTEPEMHRYWLCMSNPRRNTGGFFECFHKNRESWNTKNIDSRTVEGTDPAAYDSIIRQHGADSDEARVEVYGQFPRTGDNQFISTEHVREAKERQIDPDGFDPLIMGVDVARFGDDASVIRWRRGRDARTIPPSKFKRIDNMQLSARCAELIDQYQPDAVCIDAGNGTGVIDRLRQMGYKVHEVWFGSKADTPEYSNKRTEMWGRMRSWLPGGMIDDDQELYDDLVGPEYHYAGRDGDRIMLEPKEQMKKRGLSSPDHGDALALTFAVRVPRKDVSHLRHAMNGGRSRIAKGVDYDIFG
jgi:hypothetical protein